MKSSVLKLAFGIVILTVVFSLGVGFGFKQGSRNALSLEGVALGNILTAQAKRLHSGTDEDIKNIESLMTFYIDFGIDSFNWYETNGNHFLSELFMEGHTDLLEKGIRELSKYRIENPNTDDQNLVADLFDDEEKKLFLEKIEARKKTVSLYGVE